MEEWKNGRVEEGMGGRMEECVTICLNLGKRGGGGYAPESSVQILYTPLKNNFY